MIRFEDILDQVESYKPGFDQGLLERAYVFSAASHKDQMRRSGEPYLIHPLNVAFILSQMRLDEATIAVGLLHDVLEDTLTTKDHLQELFGEEVAEVVDGVTKISRFAYVSREEQQAETFRKMILASVSDVRVILVKLADRLHNMRTLDHMPEERRKQISKETLEIYAPIANRLGIGRVKVELEDLAFRYTHPREYEELDQSVRQKMTVSADIVERIRGTIATVIAENGVEGEVTGRMKSMYSIWSKLRRQGIDIGQLYDYLAFRIVTPSVKDCYAALGFIHQAWRPVPGRIKDYIAMPKPNLYQSLHTTVVAELGQPFEVQIRTREMDLVAEQGIAAHWKYKEGKAGGGDESSLQWLRQLVEWQQEVNDPRVFMQSLKVDLYPDEVYTFTPKGDVFAFPRGATPLDFAYQIHTDVGHRCVGARVNGKLVPLRTSLRNGDIVEILTGPNQSPNREWLGMVVTSRARHKIRHWLNTEQKTRSTELGRKLFEKEAKKFRLSVRKLIADGALEPLLQELGYQRAEDLWADVGYGKLAVRAVIDKLVPENQKGKDSDPPGVLQQAVRKIFPFGGSGTVLVRGQHDLLTYLAKCCTPIPGEDIVGYVTRGKGIAVHSRTCPNVRNLMYNSDLQIEVGWADEKSSAYEVELEVRIDDRTGLLAKVVSAIANQKINIRNIDARTSEGKGTIGVTIEIAHLRQLEKTIKAIAEVEGVVGVQRRYSGSRPTTAAV